jgi:hypothetical protein
MSGELQIPSDKALQEGVKCFDHFFQVLLNDFSDEELSNLTKAISERKFIPIGPVICATIIAAMNVDDENPTYEMTNVKFIDHNKVRVH